jgi:hypothetical protein
MAIHLGSFGRFCEPETREVLPRGLTQRRTQKFALSRRKQGFESPRERQSFQEVRGTFVAITFSNIPPLPVS